MMLNPVLARELRVRMRGRSAAVIVTLYTGVLALILWLIYRAAAGRSVGSVGIGASVAPIIGRVAFHSVLFVVLILVCFIVPGLVSASIAGERERQTLTALQVSLLRPRQIVMGKLFAGFAFVALLIVVTLPIMAGSLLLGGVTIAEMVKGTLMVLWVGFALAAATIAISAVTRRVQTATVLSYGLMLLLLLGTFLAYGGEALARRESHTSRLHAQTLLLNPLVATASVLSSAQNLGYTIDSPFTPFQSLVPGKRTSLNNLNSGIIRAPDGRFVPIGAAARFAPGRARPRSMFWLQSAATFAVLVVVSLTAATRRVRTPAKTLRA